MQLCKLFLRALEPEDESFGKNTSWLLIFFKLHQKPKKATNMLPQWPHLNLITDSQNQQDQPINISLH